MSVHIAFETPQDVQEQVYEMVKVIGKDGRGRIASPHSDDLP